MFNIFNLGRTEYLISQLAIRLHTTIAPLAVSYPNVLMLPKVHNFIPLKTMILKVGGTHKPRPPPTTRKVQESASGQGHNKNSRRSKPPKESPLFDQNSVSPARTSGNGM